MLKQLVIILGMIVFMGTASAQGQVTPIEEGDPAPFSGTLFDDEAAARVLAELEHGEAICDLRVETSVERERITADSEMRGLNISLEMCETRFDEIMRIKDEEIELLTEALDDSAGDLHIWWMAGGIVIGVVATLGAGWAIAEIAD